MCACVCVCVHVCVFVRCWWWFVFAQYPVMPPCAGQLLSVAPWVARLFRGLFSVNERVVLSGVWEYGSFTFTAVGAFSVGSINMEVDKV